MTATFVRCQCFAPECQCRIEVTKAVTCNGKAFSSEGCVDEHGCGRNRGLFPNAPVLRIRKELLPTAENRTFTWIDVVKCRSAQRK